MTTLDDAIPRLAAAIPQLTTICRVEGRHVEIEIDPGWSTACPEERAGYAERLAQAVKGATGSIVTVRVLEAGSLGSTSSRTRRSGAP